MELRAQPTPCLEGKTTSVSFPNGRISHTRPHSYRRAAPSLKKLRHRFSTGCLATGPSLALALFVAQRALHLALGLTKILLDLALRFVLETALVDRHTSSLALFFGSTAPTCRRWVMPASPTRAESIDEMSSALRPGTQGCQMRSSARARTYRRFSDAGQIGYRENRGSSLISGYRNAVRAMRSTIAYLSAHQYAIETLR